MVKRLTNKATYKVKGKKQKYIVVLEWLKNDINGNPRYKAHIIYNYMNKENWLYTKTYTFNGHYLCDYDECKWIVNYMENKEI